MKTPSTIQVLRIHLVITLLISGALAVVDWQHALSFMLGGMFMGFNFWLLILVWGRALAKKSIALPVSIIVIKWTLFGAICVFVGQSGWVQPIPFVLGVASIAISSLTVATKSKLTSKA